MPCRSQRRRGQSSLRAGVSPVYWGGRYPSPWCCRGGKEEALLKSKMNTPTRGRVKEKASLCLGEMNSLGMLLHGAEPPSSAQAELLPCHGAPSKADPRRSPLRCWQRSGELLPGWSRASGNLDLLRQPQALTELCLGPGAASRPA